jgi:integral membrane protein
MSLLPGTPAARFRAVAIAEAVSWAGLLIGMFFKYVVIEHEVGVQVFGPVHGIIFMVYVAVTLVTWGALRWSTGTGVLAVLASVPPFGSWVFERWAARHGRLDPAPA